MNKQIEETKSYLKNYFYNNKKTIIVGLLGIIFCVSFGGFITYQIMQRQIEQANQRIEDLRASQTDEEMAREIRLVKNAVEDLRQNKPVIEKIAGTNTTEIRYIEKEKADDPDVDIQHAKPSAKVRYNDQTYDIPMQTKTTTSKNPDGTVKITEGQELTIDTTAIVNRQIAAYQLNMEDKQRELEKELKHVKTQNKIIKGVGAVVGTAVIYSAVKNALDKH